jgi:hypothetical protein
MMGRGSGWYKVQVRCALLGLRYLFVMECLKCECVVPDRSAIIRMNHWNENSHWNEETFYQVPVRIASCGLCENC